MKIISFFLAFKYSLTYCLRPYCRRFSHKRHSQLTKLIKLSRTLVFYYAFGWYWIILEFLNQKQAINCKLQHLFIPQPHL